MVLSKGEQGGELQQPFGILHMQANLRVPKLICCLFGLQDRGEAYLIPT